MQILHGYFFVIDCQYSIRLYSFLQEGEVMLIRKKSLTDSQILEELSLLAVDKEIAANYRIKALELLGKANKLFGDDTGEVIKAVKIVDDVP